MASPYFATVSNAPQPYLQQPYRANTQPLVNNATTDPYLKEYLDTWKRRAGELQADEGRLRAESDARTKQLVTQATGDISDRAAGANAALSEDLARRGVAGSGVETGQRSGISGASQRQQARAATDITLAQNQAYENQKLARQQQQNAFIASGLSAAGSIGNNMLDQQRVGLQQQALQNNQSNQDLQNWMNFYRQNPVSTQNSGQSRARSGASSVFHGSLG